MSKKTSFNLPKDDLKKEPHIALLLMCKNETKRIHVTLDSVLNYVDSLVVYDTGSTDNTMDILKDFANEHKVPLRLKEGVFENFATSRNVSLDFADTFTDIDYLLLMDVNDELRGGNELRDFAREHMSKPDTAFLVCQEWFSGGYSKYYNMRFIKARKGWRYMGRVHEWLKNTEREEENNRSDILRLDDKIVLFQNRVLDDDKTGKRFSRDKILLLEDHHDNPTEPRTAFYLAQTCVCLNQFDEALYYYKLRTTLIGFYEERYEASFKCGDLTENLKHDWSDSMGWYLKAFELIPRAEPLIRIAKHYIEKKQWELAYIFSDMACRLDYPHHCHLFVNKNVYDYERWHVLGIAGWYSRHLVEGRAGCLKALQCMPNSQLDKDNLKFYEDMNKETQQLQPRPITKEEFISKKIEELARQNPRQIHSQIAEKAKMLWKIESRKKSR